MIWQVSLVQESFSELGVSSESSIKSAILYIGGAILSLGLIGLVWALARKKPNAIEYLISWFVAVAFYLFLTIIV